MIFEDSILVTYLRSGEPQRVKAAWAAWYDRDVGAVWRALRRAARQGVDIEGFSHDAFVVAVRGIQSSRFRYRQGKLRRYVCVVALNLLRAEWRGRASSEIPLTALSRHDEGQAVEWVAEPTVAGPETAVERRQFEQWLAGQVRAGLAELALEERRLLLAYHLDGRSQRELAAERKIPVATVGVRLWRLRARLRKEPALCSAWGALAA